MTLTSSCAVQKDGLSKNQIDAIQAGAVYYGFETEDYADYIIGMEKFRDIRSYGLELFEAQLKEAKKFLKNTTPPDLDKYEQMEAARTVMLITVRHKGELVGDIIYFLSEDSDNFGKTYAEDNGFYLYPEHRKGPLAVKLLRYGDATLKKLGVSYVFMGDKEPIGGPDLSIIFKRAGYKPLSRSYVKEL